MASYYMNYCIFIYLFSDSVFFWFCTALENLPQADFSTTSTFLNPSLRVAVFVFLIFVVVIEPDARSETCQAKLNTSVISTNVKRLSAKWGLSSGSITLITHEDLFRSFPRTLLVRFPLYYLKRVCLFCCRADVAVENGNSKLKFKIGVKTKQLGN